MRKVCKKRLLAIMLAITMVWGDFIGGGITAKAEVSSITVSQTTLSSAGGTVEVTVKGFEYDDTIWYRVRKRNADMSYEEPIILQSIASPTSGNPTFNVDIPANTENVEVKYQISVNEKTAGPNWQKSTLITVEAGSGAVTVDKTELNKAIANAEALAENAYTVESWKEMKTALSTAKEISAKNDATETEVTQATSALNMAITNLVPAGEAADATKIKIHVAATDGTDISNVAFEIYDTYGTQEHLQDTIYPNEAGDIEYDLTENCVYGSTYKVRVADAEQYTCSPAEIVYTVNDDSEIEEIDGQPFTGNERPQFEIAKKGGDEAQGDTKTILVNVLDEQGQPCDDCAFAIADTSFGTAGYDGMAKYPSNGVLKVKASDQYMTSGEIRVHSFSKNEYTAEPASIKFTVEKSVIKTVNEEAYDGTQTFTIRVKKNTAEVVKKITAVVAMKNALTSDGGAVEILVAGENLTPDMNVQITENGQPITLEMVPDTDTSSMQSFFVTFPKNEDTTEKVYKVKVAASADSVEFKETTVTVAAAEEKPDKPDPDPDDKEGTVTGITASPSEVPAAGGTVELVVTGTDLTKNNWGVEVKAYIKGTDKERESLQAEISNLTASGATLTIPANDMVNDIEYRIEAGAKKDGVIEKQAQAIVTQTPKEKTVYLYPDSVTMNDGHTVVATFDENITAGADEKALKELIFIADYSDKNENKYNLKETDSVRVEGKQVILVYGDDLQLSQKSRLYFQEGALRNAAGELVRSFSWTIAYGSTVSEIVLERETFDSDGGTAVATLKGIGLGSLSKDEIEASVFMAEDSTATSIPVSITAGEEPKLSFDVPANNTDKTQCYMLRVIVNGVPVYEGTGLNPAKRAVVSVLPKGIESTEQTLGGLTITGNNKVGNLDELKNITIEVSPQVGELKTLLRLYGTNLDASKTRVRAIDENGIIWPVWDISECDGTFRFVAIAYNGHGVVGDGNSQLIEVLPPRYAGTNKTYTIQVALDGENFLEDPSVTLTVNNEGIKNESDFVSCGESDFKYIKVHYIEEGTGKEIAPTDEYKGYSISMVRGYDIAPKTIAGYTLVTEPVIDNGDNDFIGEGREYTYVYRTEKKPDDGKKPDDDKKPSDGQNDSKKPSNVSNSGSGNTSGAGSNAAKTGDYAMVWPFVLAAAGSLITVGKLGRKKREK